MNLVQACFLVILVFGLRVEADSSKERRDNPIIDKLTQALYLGNSSSSVNYTREECVWRKNSDSELCPDPDMKFILYTPDNPTHKGYADTSQADWLRNSAWNPQLENIILIHGYAGGDDTLPILVLKDAYIKNGSYNVFLVDWGRLGQPPCYPAAVHNTKTAARCTAEFLTYLRNHGVNIDRTTCVGHSLGAHVCGIMSNYLLFRMHRIVGLDPARPLVRSGSMNRLDNGDANAVHVIHTNAGHYGEMGRVGHVDFCVNGGRTQPFCEETLNEPLCSHVWAICFMAESINGVERKAEPCTRRCPLGSRPGHRFGLPVPMGQNTPTTADGSYCVVAKTAPYCPEKVGDPGDVRCCIKPDKLF